MVHSELEQFIEDVQDAIDLDLGELVLQSEDEFNENVREIIGDNINRVLEEISGCQEGELMECIGVDTGRIIRHICDEYGANMFNGMGSSSINKLIIYEAIAEVVNETCTYSYYCEKFLSKTWDDVLETLNKVPEEVRKRKSVEAQELLQKLKELLN